MEKQNKYLGLEEAAKPFTNFTIQDTLIDPELKGVTLMLIKFLDETLGLCIYNTITREFIEEPGELEEYEITLEELTEGYGLKTCTK